MMLAEFDGDELAARWRALREREPRLRIRDAAQRLGCAELALLLSGAGDPARRLRADAPTLLTALAAVGPVMTLTRNDSVVHETTGRLAPVSVDGGVGLCLGDIDLRLFFRHWAHAYAVTASTGHGPRRSLQFFDAHGAALFKVYAVEETDAARWDAMLLPWIDDRAEPPTLHAPAPPPTLTARAVVDPQALLADWAAITDVHQFNGLLRRHDVDRLSALHIAEHRWTQRMAADSMQQALQLASAEQVPIMAFVGNPGVIQIYSGTVQRLLQTGSWFNVMDPRFNLHLQTADIASVWQLRRPSSDGDIHSLECFNARGELLLTLFGLRKPGKPELASWRELLSRLQSARAEVIA